jgi:hypothetical protein
LAFFSPIFIKHLAPASNIHDSILSCSVTPTPPYPCSTVGSSPWPSYPDPLLTTATLLAPLPASHYRRATLPPAAPSHHRRLPPRPTDQATKLPSLLLILATATACCLDRPSYPLLAPAGPDGATLLGI